MTFLPTRPQALTPPTGVGLRSPHLAEAERHPSAAAWIEVHAENYMGGGAAIAALLSLRRELQVSLHGVGLSIGSAEGVDLRHLARLKSLALRVEPFLVSEHLSWSASGGAYLNDLLPLPYTEEALAVASRNLDCAQETLGRRILIENPSRYLNWRHSTIPEGEFLAELVRRTGCGVLLDVNNLYVTQHNCGADPARFLDALPEDSIGEIHLAGHARNPLESGGAILIDDHGGPVAEPVWALFAAAARLFPTAPALIEWDSNLPEFSVLTEEARAADRRRRAAMLGVASDAYVA
jgi:uncharacterized protein (UPF0276 family)